MLPAADQDKSSNFPILVVEDNPDVRKLLELTLRQASHEVVTAQNGAEALQRYQQQFFPIMITDWIMPEMNGLELCQELRQQALPGYVFILILTAKDSHHDIIAGLEAGADDYLVKPFVRAELLARLKTAKRILTLEQTLKVANEEIKELSITDALTGCYDRGHLHERLPGEIKRARRNAQPLSIIMCDLDRFKIINDTYGHQAGDLVLKAFAHNLKAAIRDDVDLVFRYGGEEFVILLSDTAPADAITLAERIRAMVAATPIELPDKQLRFTASFGITGFRKLRRDEMVSMERLIEQADQHLYACKQAGRNRVKGSALE